MGAAGHVTLTKRKWDVKCLTLKGGMFRKRQNRLAGTVKRVRLGCVNVNVRTVASKKMANSH